MMSALVLAGVMFIAQGVGWIARLGAALAGRVGVRRCASTLETEGWSKCSVRCRCSGAGGQHNEKIQAAWESFPNAEFQPYQ